MTHLKYLNISFKGNVYTLSPATTSLLKELNINPTEDYITNLLNYNLPFWEINNHSINTLIKADCYNKKLYSIQSLGRIVQCNKDGKIIDIFDNLTSIPLSLPHKQYIYTFENYINELKTISRKGVSFFGTFFLPLYDQMSNQNIIITYLNYTVRNLLSWKNGKQSKRSYSIFKQRHKNISFNDFTKQYLKFFTFDFSRSLVHRISINNQAKQKESSQSSYLAALNNLINRYSLHEKRLIEQVEQLDNYNYPGIYILCLDDIQKYYVGKAGTSIKKRIIRHYQQLNSDFDKNYGFNDVKRIFVLQCPFDFLNQIEQDFIANIPAECLLNSLVGGLSVISINDIHYETNTYKLSPNELSIITKILAEKHST